MDTQMTNTVKEKMPVSANFFLISMEAFQRRFIEIRITGALLGGVVLFPCAVSLGLTKTICCGVKNSSYSKVSDKVVGMEVLTIGCGNKTSVHTLLVLKRLYLFSVALPNTCSRSCIGR